MALTLAILAPLFVPFFIVLLVAVFFSTQLMLVLALLQPQLNYSPANPSPTPLQRTKPPQPSESLGALSQHIGKMNCSTLMGTARSLVGKSRAIQSLLAQDGKVPLKFADAEQLNNPEVKMAVRKDTLFVNGAFAVTFVDYTREHAFTSIDSEGLVVLYAADPHLAIAKTPFAKIRSRVGVIFCANEYPSTPASVHVNSPITLTDSKDDLLRKVTVKNCEGQNSCKEPEVIVELKDAVPMAFKAITEYQKLQRKE